jgi:phosphonate transport system substrate-binding protein
VTGLPRQPHRFGLVRTLEPRRTQGIAALAEALGRALGEPVVPWGAAGYRELGAAFSRGELSFAWMPPLIALDLFEQGAIGVLAIPERGGSTTYNSALLGRASSTVPLEELEHGAAAWVDPESTAGYLVPRINLAARGLDLRKLVARESFVRTHDAVVDAIASGRADFGATYCLRRHGAKEPERGPWIGRPGVEEKIRVLDVSPPIPNDALVGASHLDTRLRTRLLGFVLSPPHGVNAMSRDLLDCETFRVGTSAHYDELRRLTKRAGPMSSAPPSGRASGIFRP